MNLKLPKFVLLVFLLLPIMSLADQCLSFYKNRGLDAQTIAALESSMTKAAKRTLEGLTQIDGQILHYHSIVIANLRAQFDLSTDSSKESGSISILTTKTEAMLNLEKLSERFHKSSDKIDDLAQKIVEIRNQTSNKSSARKKNYVNDLMSEFSRSVEDANWVLNKIRDNKFNLDRLIESSEKDFNTASELQLKAEKYLNGLTYFITALTQMGSARPDIQSKLNSLVSLFYEDFHAAKRMVEFLDSTKKIIDQQSAHNARALRSLTISEPNDIKSILLSHGYPAARVSLLVEEISSARLEADRLYKQKYEKEVKKQRLVEKIKKYFKIGTAVTAIGTASIFGFQKLDQISEAEAKIANQYQEIAFQNLTTQTDFQKTMLEKYKNDLPPYLKDMLVVADTPLKAADAISKFDHQVSLSPGSVIYLLNYLPNIAKVDVNDKRNAQYNQIKHILDITQSTNSSRVYTAEEKSDLVKSIRRFQDVAIENLGEQLKLGIIESAEFNEKKLEIQKTIETVLNDEMQDYENAQQKQAEKTAKENLERKTAEEKAAARQALLDKPRHLITTRDELISVSEVKANAVVISAFEAAYQDGVWSELYAFAETGRFTNSDLIYILNKTSNYSFISISTVEKTQGFAENLNKFSGRTGQGKWSTNQHEYGFIVLEKILMNLDLPKISTEEAILLKSMLAKATYGNTNGAYTSEATSYLASILNKAMDGKTVPATTPK